MSSNLTVPYIQQRWVANNSTTFATVDHAKGIIRELVGGLPMWEQYEQDNKVRIGYELTDSNVLELLITFNSNDYASEYFQDPAIYTAKDPLIAAGWSMSYSLLNSAGHASGDF